MKYEWATVYQKPIGDPVYLRDVELQNGWVTGTTSGWSEETCLALPESAVSYVALGPVVDG